MAVKVATTCLHWSQPIVPRSPSSSQSLSSSISSQKRQTRRGDAGALAFRHLPRLDRSALFGDTKPRMRTVKRACSASLDAFSDEEFSKQLQELALRFQLSDGNGDDDDNDHALDSDANSNSISRFVSHNHKTLEFPNPEFDYLDSPWPEIQHEPPDWVARDEIIPASIERKANSVDLPLSLRIIKRKMQWEDGFREAGESACCSVKKAFSSMVFMIRELQSYALQMREALFYEDLQGILARVQKELNASFVWLFQQVFSHTPTLMVYVMILLANFTVHSMACNAAIAASLPPATATESVSVFDDAEDNSHQKFDSSTVKTFSVTSSSSSSSSSTSGKMASIGGNNGGGGKVRPVASGTDGEGRFGADLYEKSQLFSFGTTRELAESVLSEEEVALWNSIVEEASRLQAMFRGEALEQDTIRRFVSPVTAKIEADDYTDYFKTELAYQLCLAQDSTNPLLLANYAQFLFLVAQDYDRAEEYFKRAVKVEPPDAEALSKYATFLWRARNEMWAAEETFLEAIAADPSNTSYASNYAHFLWNTGGEGTCYPDGEKQDA